MTDGALTRLEEQMGIAEAAEHFGISDPKVRRLIKSGRVRSEMVEVGGRAGSKLIVVVAEVAHMQKREAHMQKREARSVALVAAPQITPDGLREMLAGLATLHDDRAATREASFVERPGDAERRAGAAEGELAAVRNHRDAALAEAEALRRQLADARQNLAIARVRLEQRGVFGRRWAAAIFGERLG